MLPSKWATGYTIESLKAQLSSGSPSQARVVYLRQQVLFAARPDLLTQMLRVAPWDNAVAVLSAAALSHPVEVQSYGAVLHSILAHQNNTHRGTAGLLWKPALHILSAAVETFGRAVPHSLYANAARTCVSGRQWRQALDLVRYCDGCGMTSRTLCLNAARAAATPQSWDVALRLLSLSGALQAPRRVQIASSARDVIHTTLLTMPWREALRVLRRRSAQRLMGITGCAAKEWYMARALPWVQSLQLLERHQADASVAAAVIQNTPVSSELAFDDERIARWWSSPEVRAAIVERACEAGQWAAALRFVTADEGPVVLTPRAVSAVIITLYQNGQHAAINRLTERIASRLRINRGATEAALVSLAKDTDVRWDVALSWVASVVPAAGSVTISRLELNHKILSLIIRMCVSSRAPLAALQWIAHCRARGIGLHDSATVEALLFCMVYGRWREALTLFAHARLRRGITAACRLAPLTESVLRDALVNDPTTCNNLIVGPLFDGLPAFEKWTLRGPVAGGTKTG